MFDPAASSPKLSQGNCLRQPDIAVCERRSPRTQQGVSPIGLIRQRPGEHEREHRDSEDPRWDTGTLNRVWVGDITYLRTCEGWLYLATVIDAHSPRVIGWAIAEHMRTDLVEQALQMAIALRGELPVKVVFHANRGTQYASAQITKFAALNGITRSMGRSGVCWDCDGRVVLRHDEDRVLLPACRATKARARLKIAAWIEDRCIGPL
ncbi:MAG: hypothetical protein DLM58_07990 [Pseudonocardiales bacterium]|nr:MAG: hypothetical protein DLM58_07990 [Pseudonocardiales bacterium]